MRAWTLQEAKTRLAELVRRSATEGPQAITRQGVEAAVIVSPERYRVLRRRRRPNLKELLLAPEPRFELDAPRRRKWRRRAADLG